jgi:hypothetical protein
MQLWLGLVLASLPCNNREACPTQQRTWRLRLTFVHSAKATSPAHRLGQDNEAVIRTFMWVPALPKQQALATVKYRCLQDWPPPTQASQ